MQPETLTIQGELREIAHASAFAAQFCRAQGIDENHERTLILILEELITNTVKHGKPAAGRPITLTLQRSPAAIEIGYRDHGTPFDPNKDAPAPDLGSTLIRRPAGGLGWPLIKFYCSRLNYRRDRSTNLLALRVPLDRAHDLPR